MVGGPAKSCYASFGRCERFVSVRFYGSQEIITRGDTTSGRRYSNQARWLVACNGHNLTMRRTWGGDFFFLLLRRSVLFITSVARRGGEW